MQLKWYLCIFASLLVNVSSSSVDKLQKNIVCYFNSSAIYRTGRGHFKISNIRPELCTHLVYSYAGINPNGTLTSLDPRADLPDYGGKNGLNEFNKLHRRYSKIKTIIAVGGPKVPSKVFSNVAADDSKRRLFVESSLKFIKNYGFDGLSVDWQYPNKKGDNPADKENFVQLLKQLKEKFNNTGLLLMATVSATPTNQSYNILEVAKYLDIINLMTFDFHSSQNKTVITSPVDNTRGVFGEPTVNSSVKYWISQGAPAQKLVMGIPAYGRSFTLKNPVSVVEGQRLRYAHVPGDDAVGPGKPGPYTKKSGLLGYNEIVEILTDNEADVMNHYGNGVFAYVGDQWFTFDEHNTIKERAKIIKHENLAGVMLYSIDTDDFLGVSRDLFHKKYPLLKFINEALDRKIPFPTTITSTTQITQLTSTPSPKNSSIILSSITSLKIATRKELFKPNSSASMTANVFFIGLILYLNYLL